MSDQPSKADGSIFRCRKVQAHHGLILWRAPIPGDPKAKHVQGSPYLDQLGINPENAYSRLADFAEPNGLALATVYPWLAAQDTSAAGSPTLAFVADAACGEYQVLQDNTDEAQNLGVNQGDYLSIDITNKPVVQMRVKIDFDTLPWSADQRVVFGLGSARDATLDDMTLNAWFRIEGASANILWETDDGTTDDDDNDTAVDIVDNTYVTLRIDCTDLATVRFLINAEDGAGFKLVGTGDMSDATGNVQVFIEMQKDGGTETEDLRIDYIAFSTGR